MNNLIQKQSLPLEQKIILSKRRIKEAYEHFEGNMYVSFSGGKDSTVLLHLVRSVYPEIPALFVDTGLEYPEIKQFVKTIPNVEVLRPKITFKEVIEKYGFPVVSKQTSASIKRLRSPNISEKYKNKLLYGCEKGNVGKVAEKWKYLIDAPFKISEQCCDKLKKEPFHRYHKETGLYPFTGEMAWESRLRQREYNKTGCNAFDNKKPKSMPLATWLEEDIWEYIKRFNVPYSDIYNKGENRTGCIFCMFGVHHEQEPNRFQRLQKLHPKLHDYCMNKLGIKEVLEYMNVPHSNDQIDIDDLI